MAEVIEVDDSGVLRLSEALRLRLGVENGGRLVFDTSAERVNVLSVNEALTRLQDLGRQFKPAPGKLASEELIAERRAEYRRELIEAGIVPEFDD